MPVVRDTFQMLAGSGLTHLEPFAAQALSNNYIKPTRRVFDNAKVGDHFAIIPTHAGAARPVGGRAEALRPGGAALHGGVLPVGGVPGHDADLARRRPQLQVRGQGAGQARAGWRSTASRRRTRPPKARRTWRRSSAGEDALVQSVEPKGAQDPAAGPLLGSHAARRDGRRRQAGRRRRAARGDAGEGARHAGDPRGDHRRPDQREVHAPRRARADPDRQGVPADDAAARPRGRGAVAAGADRRVGVQARRDRARPARSATRSCSKSPK